MSGKQQLTLFLSGDVMTGRGIDQILPFPGSAELHESYMTDASEYVRLAERASGPIPKSVDPDYIWGDALNVWNDTKADVGIVNLETSITVSNDFWPSKGIHYRMHPRNVPCLTAASIDCCVLANNHVMDWGYAGLAETLATLRNAGLSTVGAGKNIDEAISPARIPVEGKGNVLVFGFADGSCGVPDSWQADEHRAGVNLLSDLTAKTTQRIAKRIRALKKNDDTVVASIHWGGNWGHNVTAEQREFAHCLIDDGGVDIVHGHSSHHPKAIEIRCGKGIIYGCGDFLNDYEGIGDYEHYHPWLALMYMVTVSLPSREIDKFEIVPLRVRRMQLSHASPDDRQWLTETLNTVSKEFSTRFDIDENHRMLVGPASL